MTFREKTGYILMLLVMIALFIVAIKFSTTLLGQLNELLKKGEQVEAEVIRVEEKGNGRQGCTNGQIKNKKKK